MTLETELLRRIKLRIRAPYIRRNAAGIATLSEQASQIRRLSPSRPRRCSEEWSSS